jgi:hypothetical protein
MRGAVLFPAMKPKALLPALVLIIAFAFLFSAAALFLDRLASLPARALHSASIQAETEVAKVRDAFSDLFHLQPTIKVNEKVVLAQTATTPELAVVSSDVEVTRDSVQVWWGSAKTIRIRSLYRVRAGFDLSQRFEVQVQGSEIAVDVPRAKILSVEAVFTKIEELRDGLWNKIQACDVEKEVNKMPEIARSKSSSLPGEAEKTFRQLLTQKMGDQYIRLEFIPETAEPKSVSQ